jgi:hypothetical protein
MDRFPNKNNIEELSTFISVINNHNQLRLSCLKQLEKRMGSVIIENYDNHCISFILSPNNIVKDFTENEGLFHVFISRLKRVFPSTDYYNITENIDDLTINIDFYEGYTQNQLRTLINKIKSLNTGHYKFRGISGTLFNFEINPNIKEHKCFIKFIGRKDNPYDRN